ncbi:hypothetical protein XELAEV_18007106mg [Xenopus laevis]|uniref:Ig-like domain-containing protein n=1 Tax=Xenopus laevis TaxID=8355 RepID=A0A974I4N6_XENLA|nr:hypothetical protein XELAEV_18007106mg [Xenopus laevis]
MTFRVLEIDTETCSGPVNTVLAAFSRVGVKRHISIPTYAPFLLMRCTPCASFSSSARHTAQPQKSVKCQISLTQPGTVTVKPSEVLQLTCKVTGASLTDSSKVYAVDWVHQPAGKGLEWLGRIVYSAGTNYAQSLQGRITVSRDTNKGEVYLKLTGMKPEETAVYYCTGGAQWDIYCESRCKNML